MLKPRYWMTGCMALVLLAAQQAPARQQRVDADSRRGCLRMQSKYPVDETIRKIESAARSRGLLVLAVVDAARDVPGDGVEPTRVLVLGDRTGTTPVLQDDGSGDGIDLPMRVLVASREDGSTEVTISDPASLAREVPDLPAELARSVEALPALMDAALS